MDIHRNYPLKALNTFSLDVYADYFVELSDYNDVLAFIRNEFQSFDKYLMLGGGSNLLFTGNFHGLIMAVRNKGIEITEPNGTDVWVTAQAGENWEELVDYCTDKGFGGLQNLAMIPGNAGSSPIQNIGAYGSELKDVFHHLTGIFLASGETGTFNRQDCRFGYRDSIFKRELKDKFLITSITLELHRDYKPDLQYKGIRDVLLKNGIDDPSITQVRDVIKEIRRSKLPDPKILGNAGSFFKNPVITEKEFILLKEQYPDIQGYPQGDKTVKIAAGWLIEQCGWKGKRVGHAGVHENQALVLINFGKASGSDITALAEHIKTSVYKTFNIILETEVNIID